MFKKFILVVFLLMMVSLLSGCVIWQEKGNGEADLKAELPIGEPEEINKDKVDVKAKAINVEKEDNICLTDDDCIPIPSECHPKSCIYKKDENNYKKPEICTEEFNCSAVYKVDDCLCHQGVCVNEREFNPNPSCN